MDQSSKLLHQTQRTLCSPSSLTLKHTSIQRFFSYWMAHLGKLHWLSPATRKCSYHWCQWNIPDLGNRQICLLWLWMESIPIYCLFFFFYCITNRNWLYPSWARPVNRLFKRKGEKKGQQLTLELPNNHIINSTKVTFCEVGSSIENDFEASLFFKCYLPFCTEQKHPLVSTLRFDVFLIILT